MDTNHLLINARWIVPVMPAGVALEAHALVIEDGRIAAILPQAEAAANYPSASVINRPEHVLLPGLVNCHGHAAMTLFRGMADDLPLEQWLTQHMWPAEGRWVSPEFVRDGAALAGAEMLLSGTTACNDMYFFPDVCAQVMAELGLRATVGMIVIEQPTPWASDVADYFDKGLAVHDQFRGHALVRTAFAPHAPYTVGDEALARIRMLADELEVPVHMHVHETSTELATEDGRRPIARLDELGLINPQLLAVHMTQLTDAEIQLVAERGAHVVHCPESNLKLASGFCPVGRLREAGVNVALGTDGAASNNDLDMLGEMRTAALLGKAVAEDAAALPAAAALEMATLGGARALGLEHEIGSLEAGKSADVICLDLSGTSTTPVYEPLSQVVYAGSRDQVTDVWIQGSPRVVERELQTGNLEDIHARAQGWAKRIRDAANG